MLAGINVLLGRSIYTDHGHSRIFPNNFTLLIGEPASRKSTAVLLTKKLLADAGYTTFAASKTTRERFFMDLAGIEVLEDDGASRNKSRPNYDNTTELNLFGELTDKEPKETFIAADEFTTFTRMGNMEFFDDLGQMWDWDSETIPFEDKVKNSKSVKIYQPTINILAGTTSENFNRAFPPETLGTGFLSRLLLIYGKRSERKFAFPKVPTDAEKANFVSRLASIRGNAVGKRVPTHISRTPAGEALLERIYLADGNLTDPRFAFFTQRRFTHLLKLCLTVAVALGKEQIDEEVAIVANTYLAAAEVSMPLAIGEFGKSKLSDVANKIVQLLDGARKPVPIQDIWKVVHKDLTKIVELGTMMQNLVHAKRVQQILGVGGGYLPYKEPAKPVQFVDWSLLTKEERDMV